MNTKLFKTLKQTLAENGFHKNGDLWGSALLFFFDVAEHLYHLDGSVPSEWEYSPGMSSSPDTDSYNYGWLSSLSANDLVEIGNYMHRLTGVLRKLELDY